MVKEKMTKGKKSYTDIPIYLKFESEDYSLYSKDNSERYSV